MYKCTGYHVKHIMPSCYKFTKRFIMQTSQICAQIYDLIFNIYDAEYYYYSDFHLINRDVEGKTLVLRQIAQKIQQNIKFIR